MLKIWYFSLKVVEKNRCASIIFASSTSIFVICVAIYDSSIFSLRLLNRKKVKEKSDFIITTKTE